MAFDLNTDLFWKQTADVKRFTLDLRPPKGCKLTVVSGGRERCEPDYLVERESFPYHCIEFVLSGEGRFEIDGRRFGLSPGTMFSYGPGTAHKIENSKNAPMTKYFVDFAGSQAKALLKSVPLETGSPVELGRPEQCYSLFEELIHQGQGAGSRTQGICVKILECIALAAAQSSLPHGSLEGRAAAVFRKCDAFIRKNFMRVRSIGEVSAECSIETAYMCRLFKRFAKESPYRQILRLRMTRAAELLRDGAPLVKEVAEECGFSDQYLFSRQFRRVMGLSPARYRKLTER